MTFLTTRRMLFGALTSLGVLAGPTAAEAYPRGWSAPPPPSSSTIYDAPWTQAAPPPPPAISQAVPYGTPYGQRPYQVPVAPGWVDAQTAQRCNVGRLVGGLVGGAVGYGASRKDGRAWAVPLGALLGQGMGCNLANNRTPLPW